MRYYPRVYADNDEGRPDPELIDLAAEVLHLLSDSTRINIIVTLHREGELPVNTLAESVGRSPSGVSQHLARLRMARMVTARRQGTSVFYRLTDEHALALVTEAVKQAEHAVSDRTKPPHHH